MTAPPCVGQTDTMFPANIRHDRGRYAPETKQAITDAKALCETCHMKTQCFELAIMHNEDHGVWGGVFFGNRREKYKMIRNHLRQKPELAKHSKIRLEVVV